MLTQRSHRSPYFFRPTAARVAFQVGQHLGKQLRRMSTGQSSSVNAKENLRGGVSDTVPLTTQRDTQEYYKKRPRRRLTRRARVKRAKRKRFARSVRRVMLPRLGTYQFVKANVGSSNWLANQAVAKAFMLGHATPSGFSQTSLLDPIGQFFINNASLANTAHILIQTMTMELSIMAASTNTSPIDLDIYTVECVKDVPLIQSQSELVTFYDNYTGLENTSEGVIPVDDSGSGVPRSGTTVSSIDRGWSPFNAALASRFWKVVKKEKVLLVPGGTTHIQLHRRFKVPKRIPTRRLKEFGYLSGLSTAYLLQAFSLWTGAAQPAGSISYNTEYTYSLKYEPNNESTIQSL